MNTYYDFTQEYLSDIKSQNEMIEYCYNFWYARSKKVLKKSEQFNVIHTTMGLLKILQNINTGLLRDAEESKPD